MQTHADTPDASFHTLYPLDEAAQTGSHNHVSLSTLMDNESNVLISRNPHSAASTKHFALFVIR